MEKHAKIYVAGHTGLVGSALVRKLELDGYTNIITQNRTELNLLDQEAVQDFFAQERPDYVFLAAAKVGGIVANRDYPADFIHQNLQIQNNIIHNAYVHKTKKLLFLGSSCIYPKHAEQPIAERALLTGPLEETNRAYAIAKIAGIEMCKSYNSQYGTNFISVMPTNLYGPRDNFDLETSHVLPALIRRFHEAKQANAPSITLWGSGTPMREFLHVDDLADALVFCMQNYKETDIINIGTGKDISIKELAEIIKSTVGYTGDILWDESKPDGTPRKLLDVSRVHGLGWEHAITLQEGVRQTYQWYLQSQ